MQTAAFRLGAALMVVLVAVQADRARGQSTTSNGETSSLQAIFEKISGNPPVLPGQKDFEKIEMGIPAAPPQEISGALPAIMATLHSDDDTIKHYAGAALIAIGTRPDSAELLRPHIFELTAFLNSPRSAIQSGILSILALLKPAPPPETFAPLLQFASRVDGDPAPQVGALGLLLRYRSDEPKVAQVVHDFSVRRLDPPVRMNLLKAIRLSRTTDPVVQDVVLRSLDESDPGVKISAIDALERMGKGALTKAEPGLRRLALSPDEHPEVKAEAAKALKLLQGEAP